MTSAHATTGHDAIAEAPGHVVPLRLLVGVLAALIVLTVVTVAVTYVNLGPLNLVVALLIAMTKATLVLLFFMHLRWDRPFNAVVLIISLALVVLFMIFALIDSYQYQPSIIPDFSTAQQATAPSTQQ